MKELFKRFKELTGFGHQEVADKAGVSRQHIYKSLDNYSMTYKTSMAAIMNYCIDDKIEELEQHISELKQFKKEVIQRALVCKEEQVVQE